MARKKKTEVIEEAVVEESVYADEAIVEETVVEETIVDEQPATNELKRCSICNCMFTGYGNNAQPINDGRCCDVCNLLRVVPERLKQLEV